MSIYAIRDLEVWSGVWRGVTEKTSHEIRSSYGTHYEGFRASDAQRPRAPEGPEGGGRRCFEPCVMSFYTGLRPRSSLTASCEAGMTSNQSTHYAALQRRAVMDQLKSITALEIRCKMGHITQFCSWYLQWLDIHINYFQNNSTEHITYNEAKFKEHGYAHEVTYADVKNRPGIES